MALIYPHYNRILRATSEVPSSYDFLSRRIIRARSAMPDTIYEDSYRADRSSIAREISRFRQTSLVHQFEDEIIPPYSIVNRALTSEYRPRRSYLDSWRTSGGYVHAKITIRKKDDFWHKKYLEDIVNARPSVYVVRPRVVVQRPIHIVQTPPPIRIYEPLLYKVVRHVPRTTETVHTYRRITNYTRPSYLLTQRALTSSSSSSSSLSSYGGSSRYIC